VSRRLVLAAAAVTLVGGLAIGGGSLVRVWHMKRELETVERDLGALKTKTETLARTIEQLRNDPLYTEKLAREELGYVRAGDTVLKFPSPPR
jgi:cell division protein FtsB